VTARVAVFGRIPASGLEVLHQVAEVWSWDDDEHIPDDVRNRELATAHAAVTLLTNKVDDAFLDAAPSLKIVANVAVGFNNIDVAACARRGVVVTNTPGVLADATADLAMALILMVTRRMAEGERLIRSVNKHTIRFLDSTPQDGGNSGGIVIEDASGNSIVLTNGKVTVHSVGVLELDAATIMLTSLGVSRIVTPNANPI